MFSVNHFKCSHKYSEGKLSGGINEEGVKYYNNLINELLAKGKKSICTVFSYNIVLINLYFNIFFK